MALFLAGQQLPGALSNQVNADPTETHLGAPPLSSYCRRRLEPLPPLHRDRGPRHPEPRVGSGVPSGSRLQARHYEESLEYFHRLDDASERITLVRTGHTCEGRDWFIALISSPGNLGNVARYREIAHRLAHPSGLTNSEARALAREGKAIVDVNGGLHATEVAGAQHTIALAHELVSSEDPTL